MTPRPTTQHKFHIHMNTDIPNRKYYIFGSCLQNTSIMQYQESRQPPEYTAFFKRQVTQITNTALYKHLALLFSDSSQLCSYMTTPHILAPNICKCYQDYFQSTPVHSYLSMSSIVYYYTKVLLAKNYFHQSFIEKEHNYIRLP